MTMANANAAPSLTVKFAVCVMKPGPTADIDIKNIAESKAYR